jgi:hypothetical protein
MPSEREFSAYSSISSIVGFLPKSQGKINGKDENDAQKIETV